MKPIWVVDDDQSIRFVLERALSREHLPVRSFSRPQDVLNEFDAGVEPQVLVTDIRMPGSSGIERSESSGKKAAWLASVAGAGSPATQRPK